MTMDDAAIHICDDWINIKLPDWETIIAAQIAFSASRYWTEIVPGIDSIAVQFDPALTAPDEAARMVSKQLADRTVVTPEAKELAERQAELEKLIDERDARDEKK